MKTGTFSLDGFGQQVATVENGQLAIRYAGGRPNYVLMSQVQGEAHDEARGKVLGDAAILTMVRRAIGDLPPLTS